MVATCLTTHANVYPCSAPSLCHTRHNFHSTSLFLTLSGIHTQRSTQFPVCGSNPADSLNFSSACLSVVALFFCQCLLHFSLQHSFSAAPQGPRSCNWSLFLSPYRFTWNQYFVFDGIELLRVRCRRGDVRIEERWGGGGEKQMMGGKKWAKNRGESGGKTRQQWSGGETHGKLKQREGLCRSLEWFKPPVWLASTETTGEQAAR